SDTLKNLQGEHPKKYTLLANIEALLAQYSPENNANELRSCTRIPELLSQTEELSKETSSKISALHVETIVLNRTRPLARITQDHRDWVASILLGTAAANNEHVTQAA
ncbi:MAG: hypothetical protein PHH70_04700, partial [Candidatus Gracilibacteria bacterium]|nr:hypothetical protein [Candidatus Gracilibacteria bacterium]